MWKFINNPPPHRYYWICQLAGWFLFFLVQTLLLLSTGNFEWHHVLSYVVLCGLGVIFSHGYRFFILRWDWLNMNIPKMLVRVVPASIIIAGIWVSLYLFFYYGIYGMSEKESEHFFFIATVSTVNSSFVIFMWSVLYFGFHFFHTFKQAEIDRWKLESAAKEAELIALKSQVNPHFLFNSLNNIRGLIIEDPEKARDMLTRLSELLRYSVKLNHAEKVSLREELEVVEDYLQLESIQFEERLWYGFDIDPASLSLKIPPMVIQILVENAIKHGIATLPQGGEVLIRTRIHQDQLDIEVINTGQLQEEIIGNGIGLKNASQRLQLLSSRLSQIQLSNYPENRVAARFSVPLEMHVN